MYDIFLKYRHTHTCCRQRFSQLIVPYLSAEERRNIIHCSLIINWVLLQITLLYSVRFRHIMCYFLKSNIVAPYFGKDFCIFPLFNTLHPYNGKI
jgi:hypothetical protein